IKRSAAAAIATRATAAVVCHFRLDSADCGAAPVADLVSLIFESEDARTCSSAAGMASGVAIGVFALDEPIEEGLAIEIPVRLDSVSRFNRLRSARRSEASW